MRSAADGLRNSDYRGYLSTFPPLRRPPWTAGPGMDSSASGSSELHTGGVGLVEARLRGSSSELHDGGIMLVEAQLRGGAPWGFHS
ncbi:unnamed protein product [Arctogadus glacialis]